MERFESSQTLIAKLTAVSCIAWLGLIVLVASSKMNIRDGGSDDRSEQRCEKAKRERRLGKSAQWIREPVYPGADLQDAQERQEHENRSRRPSRPEKQAAEEYDVNKKKQSGAAGLVRLEVREQTDPKRVREDVAAMSDKRE